MSEVFLYNHGGSKNHGCEALVRTVCSLLHEDYKISLLSESPQEDIYYDIQKLVEIKPAKSAYSKFSFDFFKAYLSLRKGDYIPLDVLPYKKSLEKINANDVEISIGGDIYCYDDYRKFIELHKLICKKGCKTVLLGCSLEKALFDDPEFIEDINRYDLIFARESLTYKLLEDAGVKNISLIPDSAFTLPAEKVELPESFIAGNTVGLNISPLVLKKESSEGIVMANCRNLIQSILTNTDCAVALIPHVVWQDNDDRTVLKILYDEFKSSNRVLLIEDANCMQLKGYISQCRFFIGARTHATIAAYSTCVPTLVLGYSIKSRGIARDLFGDEEHYVLPVQDLQKENDLTDAFMWLSEHEQEIKNRLESVIPEYKAKAGTVGSELDKHLNK